jgi:hypothetical protein
MNNIRRTKTKIIYTETIMAALAVVIAVAATVAAPAVQQILPSAYAATATGGSAITEGACSTGSFADNFLASVTSACGPNSSGSAAGDVALCMGDEGSMTIGIKGTCSTSN